jgi:hypothetical protein
MNPALCRSRRRLATTRYSTGMPGLVSRVDAVDTSWASQVEAHNMAHGILE